MATSTSSINFGGLNTSSTGSTSLSTTLFGVDVGEMVDMLVEAKSVPNTLRQDKIDANTAKISAYSELETLLATLQNSVQVLRNPSVVSGKTDVFDTLQSYSKASGSINASELYGVTVAKGAEVANYSLTINRIATKDTVSGTAAIANKTTATPLSTAGTLTINGVDVALTSSMTLENIRNAINDADGLAVTASIVQAGTNDYRLVLKADDTGKAISLTDNTTGTTLSALGLAASGKTNTNLSAEVVLDGVTVVSASNSLNDLITGVSIELYQADAGKPIALSVERDLSSISDAVSEFLASYNDLVDFVKAQRAVTSEGAASDEQVLFNDGIMNSTYRVLQSMLSSVVQTGGAVNTLAAIGVELDRTGHLVVEDDTLFEDALLGNLEQVRALFGYSYNESSGIVVADRPAKVNPAVNGKEVTLRVTATDASGLPTAAEFEVGGVVYAATLSNGLIRGASNSPLEGFVVGYEGGALGVGETYEGTFKPVQGLADQFAVYLDSVLADEKGSLKTAVAQLEDTNSRLESQILRLEGQLEIYRETMLRKFDAAQKMMAALESQKNSIQALVESLTGNND